MLQAHAGGDQQADTQSGKAGTQDQRGGGFDARMAVWMVGIGMLVAVPVGKQHQHIGQQIGKRMQTIGHQRLRFAEKSGQHLQHGQHQIDEDAHPGAFARGSEAHRVGGFEGGGLVMRVCACV